MQASVGQREPQRRGFHVTEADIGRFLEEQRVKGLSKETLARYENQHEERN